MPCHDGNVCRKEVDIWNYGTLFYNAEWLNNRKDHVAKHLNIPKSWKEIACEEVVILTAFT